jgi:drug/metabolite transporter (DMT)-like permease
MQFCSRDFYGSYLKGEDKNFIILFSFYKPSQNKFSSMRNSQYQTGLSVFLIVGWFCLIAGLIALPGRKPVRPQEWDYKIYRKTVSSEEFVKSERDIIAEPEKVYQFELKRIHRAKQIALFLIGVGGIIVVITGFAVSEKQGCVRIIDAIPSAVRNVLYFIRTLLFRIFTAK